MLTTSKFVELALSPPGAMPRIGVQTPILLTRPDRERPLFLTVPPNLLTPALRTKPGARPTAARLRSQAGPV